MEKGKDIAPINEDLNIVNYEVEQIKQKIYFIRGKQVMLDSDVAEFFEYTTKDLNRNVKNNIERFPEHYCFQLTEKEYESLRYKIFTLKKNGRGQHRKYLPFVFTEYGITMLAGLLKSPIAVDASIKIVNSFIEMRKIINSNQLLLNKINNIKLNQSEYQLTTNEKFKEYDTKFEIIFSSLLSKPSTTF